MWLALALAAALFQVRRNTAIDTAINAVTATVPVGTSPMGVAVDPAGERVCVANFGSNTVSVIDTATNAVIGTVPVGDGPLALGQFIGPKILFRVADAICDVQLNKLSYVNGDTVTASMLRLRNPAAVAKSIELKVWLVAPGSSLIPFLNIGADGSLSLPGGFDQNLGPMDLFTVTADSARGNYEFDCRMLHPVTGGSLATGGNSFSIEYSIE